MLNINENLNSNNIIIIIETLKEIIKLISKGINIEIYIPNVIKTLFFQNIEILHLISIILSTISTNSDLLLLTTGSLIKFTFETNPILRIFAFKTLISINNLTILPIILEELKRLIGDMNPYMRRECCLSLIKIYELNKELLPELKIYLKRFLLDQSIITLSSAIYTYSILTPDEDELIEPIFENLCNSLLKLDIWSQTILLRIFYRYVRRNFLKQKNFENEEEEEEEDFEEKKKYSLLILNVQPLLNSIDQTVIISACSLFYYCSSNLKKVLIVKPLIRIIFESSSFCFIALQTISTILIDYSEPFIPHLRLFFPMENDLRNIKLLKIQIISQLAKSSNIDLIIQELLLYIYNKDEEFSRKVIQSIGRAIIKSNSFSYKYFYNLIKLLSSNISYISSESLYVLCILLKPLPLNDNNENLIDLDDIINILKQLLRFFGKIDDIESKSALISLIADKINLIPIEAHEVLRQLAITFPHQSKEVKLQTINLSIKLSIIRLNESIDLINFVLTQSIYDNDIDIRDYGKLNYNLLFKPTNFNYLINIRNKSNEFLFFKKPIVEWDFNLFKSSILEIGSISYFINRKISNNYDIINWIKKKKKKNDKI